MIAQGGDVEQARQVARDAAYLRETTAAADAGPPPQAWAACANPPTPQPPAQDGHRRRAHNPKRKRPQGGTKEPSRQRQTANAIKRAKQWGSNP